MNIIFGKLVGDFNGYFLPQTTVTESQFKRSVNQNSFVLSNQRQMQHLLMKWCRLFLVYLFIGKFVLTYVSMVSC